MDFPDGRLPSVDTVDQADLIDRLETRARGLGLSMTALCRRADLAPSTFFRWKRDGRSFTVEKYNQLVAALRESERAPKIPRGTAAE